MVGAISGLGSDHKCHLCSLLRLSLSVPSEAPSLMALPAQSSHLSLFIFPYELQSKQTVTVETLNNICITRMKLT